MSYRRVQQLAVLMLHDPQLARRVHEDPRRHLAVSFLNTGKTMAAPGMLQWAWCLQRIIQAASKPGLR